MGRFFGISIVSLVFQRSSGDAEESVKLVHDRFNQSTGIFKNNSNKSTDLTDD